MPHPCSHRYSTYHWPPNPLSLKGRIPEQHKSTQRPLQHHVPPPYLAVTTLQWQLFPNGPLPRVSLESTANWDQIPTEARWRPIWGEFCFRISHTPRWHYFLARTGVRRSIETAPSRVSTVQIHGGLAVCGRDQLSARMSLRSRR
jgi:hypothetical protein